MTVTRWKRLNVQLIWSIKRISWILCGTNLTDETKTFKYLVSDVMSDVRRGRVLQFDDSLSLSSKWSWAVRTTSTVTKRRRWPTSWRGSIVTRWPTSRWTTTRTGDASQTSKHHDSHRSHTVSSFFQCFYDLCWQRFKTSCFQSCCGTWRQRVHSASNDSKCIYWLSD